MSLPLYCSPSSLAITSGSMSSSRRQHADVDDVLEQLALAGIGVLGGADLGQRHADHVDVVAEPRWRQRLGVVVEEVAARLDLGEVLGPRSAGSSPPSGRRRRAGRGSRCSVTRTSYQVGRPWMFDGKMLRGRPACPCAAAPAREQLVGAGRARAVDVGELDDEVVVQDSMRVAFGRHSRRASASRRRQPRPAWVISSRNFCMSQAPVGQRSAHRPQCRQTSSSLTITRPVFSSPDT